MPRKETGPLRAAHADRSSIRALVPKPMNTATATWSLFIAPSLLAQQYDRPLDDGLGSDRRVRSDPDLESSVKGPTGRRGKWDRRALWTILTDPADFPMTDQ